MAVLLVGRGAAATEQRHTANTATANESILSQVSDNSWIYTLFYWCLLITCVYIYSASLVRIRQDNYYHINISRSYPIAWEREVYQVRNLYLSTHAVLIFMSASILNITPSAVSVYRCFHVIYPRQSQPLSMALLWKFEGPRDGNVVEHACGRLRPVTQTVNMGIFLDDSTGLNSARV